MKKLTAILLCFALIAVCIPGSVSADLGMQSVNNLLDFSAMSATDNTATDGKTIVSAGADETDNVRLGGYNGVLCSPPGYSGSGYFVQSIHSSQSEYILENLVVSVDYYLTNSPDSSVKFSYSTDGFVWTDIFTDTSADANAKEYQTTLNGIQSESFYFKVTMINFGGYDGAAVKCSKISATEVIPATEAVSSLDFSSLPATDNAAVDTETVKAAGADSAENIRLGGYGAVYVSPAGYAGEGYYVQKISTPTATGFKTATFEIDYILTSPYCNATTSPYVKCAVSTDGNSWNEILCVTEITDGIIHKKIQLNGISGASSIYVRVSMLNWGSYDGASVKKSVLNGKVGSWDELFPGDFDGDGIITATDLSVLRRALLNCYKTSLEYIDYNADGNADIRDLISMKKYLADLNSVLKPEQSTAYFGTSNIEGVTVCEPSNLVVSGKSQSVNATVDVGDFNTVYTCRTLETENSFISFTLDGIEPNQPVFLDIEELHQRADGRIAYTVYVNGSEVYYRTYLPNSDGINHCFFDIPASVVGSSGKLAVTIKSKTDETVRFYRVTAQSNPDEIAGNQEYDSRMDVVLMLNETPSDLDYSYLKQLVSSYACTDMYNIGLCWEIQYMTWDKKTTEKYIDNVMNASLATGSPLYLGINSWWSGTTYSGMDGLGGMWTDVNYQQIVYDTQNKTYKLTTPNIWGNTAWRTMNSLVYNTARKARLKQTVEYIQKRTAEIEANGKALPTVHIFTENEPIYWPINWTYYDYDSYPDGVGDFSPLVVADAADDGVTLNPTDGLDQSEKMWLYKNLNTYISDVGSAMAEAASTDYITVKNGKISYPKEQLVDNAYSHSVLQAIYPNWDINQRAYENHLLKSIHFGGEWSLQLSDQNDSFSFISGDTRALDYIASYGTYANINAERAGMYGSDMSVLKQSYTYGLDGVVIYNVYADSDSGNVKAQSGKTSESVAVKNYKASSGETDSGRTDGVLYNRNQYRSRYRSIMKRADAENMFARYLEKGGGISDDAYLTAYSRYANHLYNDAYEILSKSISYILPAEFCVSGYGTLGKYPISVVSDGETVIKLLTAGAEEITFTVSGDACTVTCLQNKNGFEISVIGTDTYRISACESGEKSFRIIPGGTKLPTSFKARVESVSGDSLTVCSQDTALTGYASTVTVPFASTAKVYRGTDGTAKNKLPSSTISSLQYGDYIYVSLDSEQQISSVYAWYGRITGTVTSVEQMSLVGTVSNPYVTVSAGGKSYRFEIGGECQLNFSGATGSTVALSTVGNIGLQVGDTVSVTYSPYIVNGRRRALSIS